jgi:hypothetical protein
MAGTVSERARRLKEPTRLVFAPPKRATTKMEEVGMEDGHLIVLEETQSTYPILTLAKAEQLKRQLRRCLLCQSEKVVALGSFAPHEPALWFPGRHPWYALCNGCYKRNQREQGKPVDEAVLTLLTKEANQRHDTIH